MSFCTEEARVQVSACNLIKYDVTTQRRTWSSTEGSKGGCQNVPVEVAVSSGERLGGIPPGLPQDEFHTNQPAVKSSH